MAKIDDVNAKLDSIGQTIEAVAADEASLVLMIADLRVQVAAGTATEAGVQVALDKATAIADRLNAIDASVP